MPKPKAAQSLQHLYESTLAELYQIELQLAAALPKLAIQLNGTGLASVFERATRETEQQLERLQALSKLFGRPIDCEPSWSTAKYLVDAFDAAKSKDTFARTAGAALPLLSTKYIEVVHYQGLLAWSYRTRLEEAAGLLQPSLGEELAMAEELTGYALAACGPEILEAMPMSASMN